MYQPVLSDAEWTAGELPSFGVYHSLKKAKEDYPKHTIAAYLEGEIEEPTYMDSDAEQRKEEAISAAAHYLCDDEFSLEDQLNSIAAAAQEDGTGLIDNVENVLVWEKVEDTFTCYEFLDLVGWEY